MSEIKTVLCRNVIAEIHDHEWSDDVILAKTQKSPLTPEERKRVSLEYVEEFVERRGYEIEFYGYSGNSMRVIDEYKKRLCEECRSGVMYDELRDEYYCPVC